MPKVRPRLLLGVTAAALCVSILFALGLGAVSVPPGTILRMLVHQIPLIGPALVTPDWLPAHAQIILAIRLPRVLQGGMVGAALAMAGTIFQALFRNPLAGPYILGVSAGASLGATVALAAGWQFTVLGFGSVPFLAFLGALITLALVYQLSGFAGTVPPLTLLLAGIAVGSMASALVSLIIHFAGSDRVGGIVFWLMGGLGSAKWPAVVALAPYIVLGAAVLLALYRELNALLLGAEPALHLGVNVERVKLVLLIVAALLTGASVATSGVIGFVGLVVPHMARIVAGPDHGLLVPLAAAGGALFLVMADLAARTVLAPMEIQVGIVTALIGAPFFLWLLRRARGQMF